MVQLSANKCSCVAILWVSLLSFDTITLCVASERVFIVVYFVMTQSGNFWIHPRILPLRFYFVFLKSDYFLVCVVSKQLQVESKIQSHFTDKRNNSEILCQFYMALWSNDPSCGPKFFSWCDRVCESKYAATLRIQIRSCMFIHLAGAWRCQSHVVPGLRMCETMSPLPQYVFMAWCLVKHRDNFTFTIKLWHNRGLIQFLFYRLISLCSILFNIILAFCILEVWY
jgi:hypothetical protein